MATWSQLPATLDLALIRGDEVNFAVDFDVNLTGYTLEVAIYNSGTPAATVVATPTITTTSLANGQLGIGLTETQTGALAAGGRFRWYFRWVTPGGVTRTVLSGNVSIANP
jgi:hypothetical protein